MNADITAVILAGGRGTRMGGVDKGLVDVGGRPAVEYVIDALRDQTPHILINANRNLDRYRRYSLPVIDDGRDDFPGPLGGILAALRRCETEWLLTAPCDAPLLARDYAARMVSALRAAGTRACVAHDGEHRQPVFLLLARDMAGDLQTFLDAAGRRAGEWVDGLRPAQADFSDEPEQFLNMNTPEDRERIERLLMKHARS